MDYDRDLNEVILGTAAAPLITAGWSNSIGRRLSKNFRESLDNRPKDLLMPFYPGDVVRENTGVLQLGDDILEVNNSPSLLVKNKMLGRLADLTEAEADVYLSPARLAGSHAYIKPANRGPNASRSGSHVFLAPTLVNGVVHTDIPTALHELGHAHRYDPRASFLRRALTGTTPLRGILRSANSITPLLAPILADPDDPKQIAAALGVQTLLEAPTLAEEYLASRKANKALKALVQDGTISEASRSLASSSLRKALMTYGSSSASRIAAVGIPLALMNDDIRSSINPFD
jgi:hypothetical protein